jgi:bifunctional non-homologous end joining protein LigD
MDEYLSAYYSKRNFTRTPEPRGSVDDVGNTAFVVHRHDARNLHYDLRIASEGRLVCWAVPKGFSYDPAVKHLAVHTEDHPIQYISFEGIIPKGQYGAGPMNIWDIGTYELMRDDGIDAALRAGEIKLKLSGRKLRGEWHLVKLKKAVKDEWLIIKANDAYRSASWDGLFTLDLSMQPETGFPGPVAPMTCKSPSLPFSDPEWGFEIRLEGLRAVCVKNGKDIRFVKRGGEIPESAFLAGQFPGIGAIAPERAVIDGIVTAPDERGIPSRELLARKLADGAPSPGLVYQMLDILYFEGYDVTTLPYEKRKQLLSLVANGVPGMSFLDFVKGDGVLFAREAKRAGVSSVIAKKLDSPYEQGPSEHWKSVDLSNLEIEAGPTDHEAGKAAPRITHPEKPYFPELGLAKRDLVYYYRDVGELMLPHLRDRPVHIYRFPDGIHGKSFYQKHLPAEDIGDIDFIHIPGQDAEKESPYFMCNSMSALLHLINLGTIDLHAWFSRKGSLDHPDWIAWDLDPKGAGFAEVIKTAKEIGKILRGIGLTSFLKTSGRSGLHILTPVAPLYTYDQARMFAEGVARIVAHENRKTATVERNIDARGGRVYIDFLQNRRGQTLAAPYSVRPVPGAAVSMPVEWEELDRELSADAFTIMNAAERLSRRGDIFHPVLTVKQELDDAIRRLASYYPKNGDPVSGQGI